jgi:ATP-binding cassette subfamily B protein/subfamily B ATP-binding cassette protein MsbA
MRRWWLHLGRHALPEWRAFALLLALAAVEAGLNALKPWPVKLVIDNVLGGSPLPAAFSWLEALPGGAAGSALLAWLAAAVVVLFLAAAGTGILQARLQAGAGARIACRLGATVFDRLQRLSPRYHGRQRVADLTRRVVTDAGCVKDFTLGVCLPLATALAGLATMSVVMWRLDRTLCLLALAISPLLVVIMRALKRPMTERSYEHHQSEAELLALAEVTLSALPVVKAFGREEHEDQRFRGLSRRTLRAGLRSLGVQLGFKAGVTLVTAGGTAAMMAIGGLHVHEGELSIGGLYALLSYLVLLYAPLETLAYLTSSLAGAGGKARRVLEVLEAADEVRQDKDAKPLPSLPRGERGHVRLEDVTFGYETDRMVLRGVSLAVRPGETLALVGPTGAGKSTLASLIPRLFDPWQGRVVLDGADVRTLALSSLREQVAVVFQEPQLLPVTVAENIAYGRPEASREEVQAAARAANADGFIQRLARGYDTVIGERGATLSGGERQRLAIARALLKDSPVLILDEPTSALDAETEGLLIEALERLKSGRTTIIIAHRLSTIRRASRIAVMEEGKVVEEGTHAQLSQAGGLYQRLYTLQRGAAACGAEA